jgi:hypothetical protein
LHAYQLIWQALFGTNCSSRNGDRHPAASRTRLRCTQKQLSHKWHSSSVPGTALAVACLPHSTVTAPRHIHLAHRGCTRQHTEGPAWPGMHSTRLTLPCPLINPLVHTLSLTVTGNHKSHESALCMPTTCSKATNV